MFAGVETDISENSKNAVRKYMIKVGIVEDEPQIRMLLRRMIEKQEGFEVVLECGDFASTVTEFTKYRPEVVFMDIDLDGQSGMECARVLTEWNPRLKVIFETAHSEYMANAFEIYAFDYLVKPFSLDRVAKTLSRVKEVVDLEKAGSVALAAQEISAKPAKGGAGGAVLEVQEEITDSFEKKIPVRKIEETAQKVLQENDTDSSQEPEKTREERYKEKLMLRGKEQLLLIDKKDILMVERSGNATNIITREETFKTAVPLGKIEEKLNPSEFMRCHKSYIIHLSDITRIEPYGRWTYVVKLKGTDATALMTSQNYETLKEFFD